MGNIFLLNILKIFFEKLSSDYFNFFNYLLIKIYQSRPLTISLSKHQGQRPRGRTGKGTLIFEKKEGFVNLPSNLM
jgi:hypothetical protein